MAARLLRAPVGGLLRAPARSLAAGATASKPSSTAGGAGEAPSANLIWLQGELTEVSASQAADLDALHRETLAMSQELARAKARHADAVSECKRAAAGAAAWSCVAGGALLAFALFIL